MNKILLLLIIICIMTRFLLAYSAKIMHNNYLPYFSIITLIISLSFFKNYINNEPKIGFFGSKAWWSNYRIIHAFNYFVFTLFALAKNKDSWLILLFDVFLGIIFFINKYLLLEN